MIEISIYELSLILKIFTGCNSCPFGSLYTVIEDTLTLGEEDSRWRDRGKNDWLFRQNTLETT